MYAQRTFEQLADVRPTPTTSVAGNPPTCPPATTLDAAPRGPTDRHRTVQAAQRRLALCTVIVAVMATVPVPLLRLVLGWVLFVVVIRTAPGLVRYIEQDVSASRSAAPRSRPR